MGKRIAIEMMLVAAIGFVLGLIGPFGTYEIAVVPRLTYWVIFGVLGYAIFRPLIIMGDWLAEQLDISRILGVGMALLIASIPMTLLVAAMMFRMDVSVALQWKGIAVLYAQVFLIGLLTFGFSNLVFGSPGKAKEEVSPIPLASTHLTFESRLPPGFGPLLALRGEDHYVRAIGQTREELILMRLRDAMGELSGVEGMAVHRSWWVAREAVKNIRREGRVLTLILSNGTEVPVARDNSPLLRKAGWLE